MRGLRDPVTEDVLVFDTVEECDRVAVDVGDTDLRPVPVVVLDDVVVFVVRTLCVPFADAVDVRVPGRLRVSDLDTLILGLEVPVAVSVFDIGADLVSVELPVGVLLTAEDRVGEGEAVAVLVPPMDRVDDRVTGMLADPLDVFVPHAVAVCVFDMAEEKLMLGEAEVVLEPRGEAESVGEEEEVFEEVPEGEDVFVEVIVFVEVVVPVWVRVPWEEVVGREESVDVFERAAVFVARGVNTGVRVWIREKLCCFEGKAVFVEVVVFVDVFD